MKLSEETRTAPVLEMSAVEAFGRDTMPLGNYVNASQKIGSEFILKTGGKKRRVYSWIDAEGSATYVMVNGQRVFLSDEVDGMLTYAPTQHGVLTPVAQAVTVVE